MLERRFVENLIDREYRNRGDVMGWRLLYCRWETTRNAKAAFIGLNPGGDESNADHGQVDTAGSAYEIEDWSTKRRSFTPGNSPLQLQVRKLFRGLGLTSSQVLAGNLVPFRSPDWKSLRDRPGAIRFGIDLWERLLASARPEIIITMGNEAWDALGSGYRIQGVETHAFNWKNYVVRRGTWRGTRIVGLPHLSRFPIIGRSSNQEAIDWAFGAEFNANLDRGEV